MKLNNWQVTLKVQQDVLEHLSTLMLHCLVVAVDEPMLNSAMWQLVLASTITRIMIVCWVIMSLSWNTSIVPTLLKNTFPTTICKWASFHNRGMPRNSRVKYYKCVDWTSSTIQATIVSATYCAGRCWCHRWWEFLCWKAMWRKTGRSRSHRWRHLVFWSTKYELVNCQKPSYLVSVERSPGLTYCDNICGSCWLWIGNNESLEYRESKL